MGGRLKQLRSDEPALTLLLGGLIAAAPLAMDIYLSSMPSMSQSLGATPEQVQLTLSTYMFGWGVAQLAAGPLSDRFGRRPALIGGLALFTVASLACALAQSVEMLIAARFVQALAMAPVAVIPRAIVRDLYAGDRAAHMLSLMGMVLGIAPIVAPILGSQLHTWLGWQSTFYFVAAYGAVAWFLVVTRLPETIRARNPAATDLKVMLANYARLIRSRTYIGYLLVAAFATSGLFAFLAGSAFVFVTVLGQSEQGFGVLFGTVMLGNITGATIGSRLVRRWGIDTMIRRFSWLMLGASLLMGALAWAGLAHPLAIIVPMFLFMVAVMTMMPQATAGALTPFPDIAGSASSLLAFIQFVFASFAALIVGFAYDGTQRPMATVIAVAGVLAFASFRLLIGAKPATD
jgi:DHA1 family bicyclomycin/chloramphenicol resistance-like MFS transporter